MGGVEHPISADLVARCEAVIAGLIVQYTWEAVTAAELLDAVIAYIQQHGEPARLDSAVIACYSALLYGACRQHEDLSRQQRAFTDLFRYLYRQAHRRWPDLAEPAAQLAIVLVYEHVAQCRTPRAFLQFATWWLRHAVRQLRRDDDQPTRPIDETLAETLEDAGASVEQHAERAQDVHALAQALRALPERQRQVVMLTYLRGYSDQQIANELGLTLVGVRKLRSRGLHALRDDPRLAALRLPDGEA